MNYNPITFERSNDTEYVKWLFDNLVDMFESPDEFTDRSSINKLRKLELVHAGSIRCGLCPYNRRENAKRHGRNNRYKNHR